VSASLHGLTSPVAAALGVSPTTLVHRFGTKEQMLVAILGRLRERIAATSDRAGGQPDLATAARAAWTRTSDPQQWPEFRLFFAVYGRALQAPRRDRVQDAAESFLASLEHTALPVRGRPRKAGSARRPP